MTEIDEPAIERTVSVSNREVALAFITAPHRTQAEMLAVMAAESGAWPTTRAMQWQWLTDELAEQGYTDALRMLEELGEYAAAARKESKP